MQQKPTVIFAMKYPDSEGSIWLRVARAYDLCARKLGEAGMHGVIAYPKRTGKPAYEPQWLEPVELDMQDYAPENAGRIERFVQENGVAAVVFRDIPPSEVDLRLLRRLGVRTIDYVIGGFRPDFRLPVAKRWVNRLRAATGWRHHDLYVPNSMDGYEVLVNRLHYPRQRIRVVRNGVDVQRFSPGDGGRPDPAELGLPATEHYALMVCQARAEKRIDTMIEVAAELFRRRPGAPITFVHVGGGGLLEQWKRLAGERGVAERFRFMGRQDDPVPFYRLATIMLHVSEFEAFGNACLEAMACGLPVICSDIGGPRELIVDGETGWLLPIDDVNGFVDRILRLMDDEGRRRAMGAAGRQRACEAYSIEREVEAFFEVLREQVAKAGGGP